MPVDSRHAGYNAQQSQWETAIDVFKGEGAVKVGGVKYLPALSGQSEKDYKAYVNRGTFFNAFSRTVRALAGAMTRKGFKMLEVPKSMEPLMKDVTGKGQTLSAVTRDIAETVLKTGRVGLLVDHSAKPDSMPFIAIYNDLGILNWPILSDSQAIVLAEQAPDHFNDDPFIEKTTDQYRVLSLDESGRYQVDLYYRHPKTDTIHHAGKLLPVAKGLRLDHIPFHFINSTHNLPATQKPPLIDLLNLNMAHWRLSVDQMHGLHKLALPTPWATGWDADTPLYVGGEKAWITSNTEAKVGMLEFQGTGLSHIENKLEKIEAQMAIMGTRMLEAARPSVERAETIRVRTAGDRVTLATLAGTVEQALNGALRDLALFSGESSDKVNIELNKDYDAELITAELIREFRELRRAGDLSKKTLWSILVDGEVLPKYFDPDLEADEIEAESRAGTFAGLDV